MTLVEEIRAERSRRKIEEAAYISMEQDICSHREVLHYEGYEEFGTYHPQRVCRACGLCEVGSWWSSATQWRIEIPADHDRHLSRETRLPNLEGRSITKVKSEVIQQHRLP